MEVKLCDPKHFHAISRKKKRKKGKINEKEKRHRWSEDERKAFRLPWLSSYFSRLSCTPEALGVFNAERLIEHGVKCIQSENFTTAPLFISHAACTMFIQLFVCSFNLSRNFELISFYYVTGKKREKKLPR